MPLCFWACDDAGIRLVKRRSSSRRVLPPLSHLGVAILSARCAVAVPRWAGGGTGPSKSWLFPPRLKNIAGPQIVARPPNLAVLLTGCGQLIFGKITKFDAIDCQVLRLKCTKFEFC